MDTSRLERSAGVPPAPSLADRKHPQRSAGVPPAPGVGDGVKGWHSRGYLPHFDGGPIPQMVTFRLADSLPAERLRGWKEELNALPPDEEAKAYRERIEEYLDRGCGDAWLNNAQVAGMVESALLYFDAQRYRLHAWVVMPNHAHTLFTPVTGWSLASVLHSWKSYTSKMGNHLLDRRGDFWQEEYFDRYVRHDRQYVAARHYIEENPVKAGLVRSPRDWPFGSARLRLRYGAEG